MQPEDKLSFAASRFVHSNPDTSFTHAGGSSAVTLNDNNIVNSSFYVLILIHILGKRW